MIKRFLSVILPGDDELGLPNAASLNLHYLVEKDVEAHSLGLFFELLSQVAREKLQLSIEEADDDQFLAAIEAAKRKEVRLTSAVILSCLRHYYTNAVVLERIGSGAIPPFPEGNNLAEDDWLLLEPVFERGPIYKEVKHD
ncbi:hypothetical protein ACFOEE_04805 [Pseudoalteromonas fenneropenaei]|uniref:Uncharacterized protein n=1 Tax=Pseudoalteromonas fenneropenaei TaxID=1737459 RepID=A0ABV7CGS2_9GAMM